MCKEDDPDSIRNRKWICFTQINGYLLLHPRSPECSPNLLLSHFQRSTLDSNWHLWLLYMQTQSCCLHTQKIKESYQVNHCRCSCNTDKRRLWETRWPSGYFYCDNAQLSSRLGNRSEWSDMEISDFLRIDVGIKQYYASYICEYTSKPKSGLEGNHQATV